MRAKSLILAVSCLLFATACDEKSPTGPSVSLNQEFTLAPGQMATVGESSVRVQFLSVDGDSRCPADVLCILGGDAVVRVRAVGGGTTEYQLHTGDGALSFAMHNGLRIQLLSLQPYPFSGRTTPQEEYRAEFRVTRP